MPGTVLKLPGAPGGAEFYDVRLDPKTGVTVSLEGVAQDVPYTARFLGYERGEKTFKRTVVVPNPKGKYHQSVEEALSAFEGLVAIDTNYREDRSLSVTAAMIWHKDGNPPDRWICTFYTGIELRGVKDNPEAVGLWESIRTLKRIPNASFRCGIITDYDLDSHVAYNTREKPVLAGVYLPEDCQLIYASSDAGADTGANVMINIADKRSKELFKRIEGNEADQQDLHTFADRPYTQMRVWPPSVLDAIAAAEAKLTRR